MKEAAAGKQGREEQCRQESKAGCPSFCLAVLSDLH